VADEAAAYKLANEPFPGYFGIFYQAVRPTKNAKEAGICATAREKCAGLKDWEILKRTFAGMK
jgi:2-oxoglutarate ferredoxin oxidoreductase subunit beta